MITLE